MTERQDEFDVVEVDNENPFDQLLNKSLGRLQNDIENLQDSVDPFGKTKLTPQEQMDRYQQVRNNPQAWAQIVAEQGTRAAVEYATRMEPRYDEPE